MQSIVEEKLTPGEYYNKHKSEEINSDLNADNSYLFKKYVRPKLAELLEIVRMNIEYIKAESSVLTCVNKKGEEIEVFDFLGGYGALIFGHNNAEIKKVALKIIEEQRPFCAQGSLRTYTALLGKKLNDMLETRFGEEFISTFLNTGTEAVEAAQKHALLAHHNRKIDILDSIDTTIFRIKNRQGEDNLHLSIESIKFLEQLFPEKNIKELRINAIIDIIKDINQKFFLLPAPKFVCLNGSYHGKTIGSLSITASKTYREPFDKVGPDAIFVSRNKNDDFLQKIQDNQIYYYSFSLSSKGQVEINKNSICNFAALFIEPIQGEGGIHVLAKEYLKQAREICTENSIHLIFDEIQCGMGRSGKFLYSEIVDVKADYYLLSKSLGGGFSKISSMSVSKSAYQNKFSLIHSSTFAEDDFSSAIALKSLELLDTDFNILNNCRKMGKQIKDNLLIIQKKYHEIIVDVRGEGLMLAIEFKDQENAESSCFRALSSSEIMGFVYAGYFLHEHNIRVAPLLSNNNVIRLEPPACITEDACSKLYIAIDRLCEILMKQNFYELAKFIVFLESPGSSHPIKNYQNTYFRSPIVAADCKVAFLMHLVDRSNLREIDRSCEQLTLEQANLLLDKCSSILDPFYLSPRVVYSKSGKIIEFHPILFAITSDMIQEHFDKKATKKLVEKMEMGIDMAISTGSKLLGFGGFTSIIMKNCNAVRTNDIAVTTGNSLTVAMGIESILKSADEFEIDLLQSSFAAVGAAGNIGSIYCRIMAEKVPNLILIGRKGRETNLNKLAEILYYEAFQKLVSFREAKAPEEDIIKEHALAGRIMKIDAIKNLLKSNEFIKLEISEIGPILLRSITAELGEDKAPIRITADISDLKSANLILGASSFPEPRIFPEHLSEGKVIICDVALPEDTHYSVSEQCPNVTVIKGGNVRVPPLPAIVARSLGNESTGARDWLIEGAPIDPDHVFACMAETMILGLTGINADYSKGDVKVRQVQEIGVLAKLHGFELGTFKSKRSF